MFGGLGSAGMDEIRAPAGMHEIGGAAGTDETVDPAGATLCDSETESGTGAPTPRGSPSRRSSPRGAG